MPREGICVGPEGSSVCNRLAGEFSLTCQEYGVALVLQYVPSVSVRIHPVSTVLSVTGSSALFGESMTLTCCEVKVSFSGSRVNGHSHLPRRLLSCCLFCAGREDCSSYLANWLREYQSWYHLDSRVHGRTRDFELGRSLSYSNIVMLDQRVKCQSATSPLV